MTDRTDSLPKPPLLLTLNTVLVLGLVVCWVAMSVELILAPPPGSPFAFLGAIFFTPYALVFGAAVFYSVFRCSRIATWAVTACYFVGAGLTVFCVVGNIGEAVVEKVAERDAVSVEFLIVFGLVGLAIAAYGVFCGVLSYRWARTLGLFASHNTE